MPTGAEAFQRRQAAKEQQRAAQGGAAIKADFFSLKANTYAVVRFLEQGDGLTFADVHRVPVGRRYPVEMICLDTDDDGTACPGCMSQVPEIRRRKTVGFINLIWRDGPVYERNEFGGPKKDDATKQKIITGRADGIFLWNCSATVYQDLLEKDSKYKGLMSRDFEVKRTGSTMNDTKFSIDPADVDGGPQGMTIADTSLAAGKYNLVELTKPLEFATFSLAMQGAPLPGEPAGPQETMDRGELATAANVFQGDPPLRASAFSRG